MPKAITYNLPGYQRAHTRDHLVFLGPITPEPVPLEIHGTSYPVGTKFTKFGGHKTSAGFETLRFDHPLEYCGLFEDDLGDVALFRQGDKPDGGFFGWHTDAEGRFYWMTDARAGRVIENTIVEVAR